MHQLVQEQEVHLMVELTEIQMVFLAQEELVPLTKQPILQQEMAVLVILLRVAVLVMELVVLLSFSQVEQQTQGLIREAVAVVLAH
jgi:hypothetical protein